MNLSLYKTCFKVTAIGNILAAILAMASMSNHFEMFFTETGTGTTLRFYHYNLWAFVFVLGVGYWFLAKEPIRNRAIALIGAIGKLFFAVSCVHLLVINHAKPMLIIAVIYDGFFGILMAFFYWKTRNEKL